MILYALSDPITHEIRYIGQTTRSLQERVREHRKCRRPTHTASWIQSIGRTPEAQILAECQSREELDCLEAEYIAMYEWLGVRLTNHRAGGQTSRLSPETRGRMSRALKGRVLTAEHRRRLSESKSGWRMPEEQRARMRGRKASAETRAKMSAAKKGTTLDAEHREKIAVAQRAAWARRRRPLSTEVS